jgi:hypothetical protein
MKTDNNTNYWSCDFLFHAWQSVLFDSCHDLSLFSLCYFIQVQQLTVIIFYLNIHMNKTVVHLFYVHSICTVASSASGDYVTVSSWPAVDHATCGGEGAWAYTSHFWEPVV